MKFPSILAPFCVIALSGCAYIIPPEQNTPRSNTVIGEPHRPALNNATSTPRPQSAVVPMSAPAPEVTYNTMPDLPPVDANTQAQADQWLAQAPVPVAPTPVSGRRIPAENMQFAANDTAPSLNNVPPRPALSGPDSSRERLNAVQTDLLEDRANAQAQKDALARDAAAEPSMLSQLPATNAAVPSNDPVAIKPLQLTPPAPAPALPPLPPATIKPGASAPPLSLKPLPQSASGGTGTSMISAVPNFAPPAPPVPTGPAPIALKRPVEKIVTADLPPAPIMGAPRPALTRGDFDPLAVADNAPIATTTGTSSSGTRTTAFASDGYMAASRYAGRRN